jgi:hypothetical protein
VQVRGIPGRQTQPDQTGILQAAKAAIRTGTTYKFAREKMKTGGASKKRSAIHEFNNAKSNQPIAQIIPLTA